MVAHLIDSGASDYSVEAAISKVFASEAVQRASYEALQIAGGNGFMREFPYEQITRDTRILSIFEGTSEILRLYIALSGLKAAGTVLGELQSALGDIFNHPIKGFGVLGDYAGKRVRAATGYGANRIEYPLAPPLRKLAATYEKYAAELARVSDTLLRRHGKAIADQQYAQKRVADIAIDLFVGLCTLSRADDLLARNDATAESALEAATLFTREARRRMARNVRALERNEDELQENLAASLLQQGGYPWDVI